MANEYGKFPKFFFNLNRTGLHNIRGPREEQLQKNILQFIKKKKKKKLKKTFF